MLVARLVDVRHVLEAREHLQLAQPLLAVLRALAGGDQEDVEHLQDACFVLGDAFVIRARRGVVVVVVAAAA